MLDILQSHSDSQCGDWDEIDVKILPVGQVRIDPVQKKHSQELSHTVQHHVLEAARIKHKNINKIKCLNVKKWK